MTDPRQADAAADPKKARRGIPPLVWIVLALLVAWFVVMMVQRNGSEETTHPAQAEGTSVMPAAPASGEAPATPAGVVNGPNQPSPDKP